MNGVGWANILLGVAMLVIAYVSWWQYRRYEKMEAMPKTLRFQRNITIVLVLIALGNFVLALLFPV